MAQPPPLSKWRARNALPVSCLPSTQPRGWLAVVPQPLHFSHAAPRFSGDSPTVALLSRALFVPGSCVRLTPQCFLDPGPEPSSVCSVMVFLVSWTAGRTIFWRLSTQACPWLLRSVLSPPSAARLLFQGTLRSRLARDQLLGEWAYWHHLPVPRQLGGATSRLFAGIGMSCPTREERKPDLNVHCYSHGVLQSQGHAAIEVPRLLCVLTRGALCSPHPPRVHITELPLGMLRPRGGGWSWGRQLPRCMGPAGFWGLPRERWGGAAVLCPFVSRLPPGE